MNIMRSRWDRRIAGICGGIARSQGWDSTLVRVLWVAAVLFAGTGVLAYLVLWVLMPEEPYGLPPYAGYPPVPPPAYPYAQQPPAYPPVQPYGQAQQGAGQPQPGEPQA